MTEEKDKSFKIDVNVTSTLLERVLGSLDRATAGLTKSWRVRREGRAIADARAYEMRLIAQAESDAACIREGRARFGDDGKFALLPLPATQPSSTGSPDGRADVVKFLTEGAARIANDEALRQTTNLLRTAAKAEDFARESDAKPSTEEIDPDWLARWRRGAQDVSDEQLQQMWAQLLVSEASEAKSRSVRTIDLLSSLTRSDAELIARLGPYVFSDGYVIEKVGGSALKFASFHQEKILSMEEKIYLEELGVIFDSAGVLNRTARSFSEDKFISVQKILSRCLVLKHWDKSKVCKIKGVTLTFVGRKLIEIGDFVPNEGYLKQAAALIADLGFDVDVASWRIDPDGKYSISIFNEVAFPGKP
ncbi:MAG: DUF2806 domain-containing protein [Tagaea sp.]|nr:DUF2806 domain-containing protein [Tagaea sp.]